MKKVTTVLFDLDGTLIRMDQDRFVRNYFTSIVRKFKELGYDAKAMHVTLEDAVVATLKNDGSCTNEERFWSTFAEKFPGLREEVRDIIDGYYKTEFIGDIADTCERYPRVGEVLDTVKRLGLRAVLATNPLFPSIATEKRMELGGLSFDDFEYVTTYENSSFCKPNPNYFTELLGKLKLSPSECVMIGNDTRDDFSVLPLGIPIFILTDCLINRDNVDLSRYPHGSFDELISYLNGLS